MAAKDDVGRAGENLAARVLADEGYTIVERNWRGDRGELDIVALDGDVLVAVEVKTRSTWDFGHPAEAVTPRKIKALRRLTAGWLREHRAELPDSLAAVRIDVVAVTGPFRERPHVELLKAVS